MDFHVISYNAGVPSKGRSSVYLKPNNWNDYSFRTLFYLYVHDEEGILHQVGDVKIGFKGQTEIQPTYDQLAENFSELESIYFSLGQSTEYYQALMSLPDDLGIQILRKLNDIALEPHIINDLKSENVFKTSLLRSVSLGVIKGQYARVLQGGAPLSHFRFAYVRTETEEMGEVSLKFNVVAESTPSTNIHAIIGRNGVGKTTILNGMINAITSDSSIGFFKDLDSWNESPISEDYFSSLVSVSFSAFDPFSPPSEQSDPTKGTCYFYIGLKKPEHEHQLKTSLELRKECADALFMCFSDFRREERWLKAIKKLSSDENFDAMKLERLRDYYHVLRKEYIGSNSDFNLFLKVYGEQIDVFLSRMSSGHAVVLLIISRLVATMEEKTLVLLDEPESHLHPPLLSAFTRALSDLLYNRNGVAIIATHSPVILQEIPKSCVWKVNRYGKVFEADPPEIETFGENVGTLTSEVFGLEVSKSGFLALLKESVHQGNHPSYDEILREYNFQLGAEARAILKSLVATRDRFGSVDDSTE